MPLSTATGRTARRLLRKPYLLLRSLREPVYVFRPAQLIRRIGLTFGWGLPRGETGRSHLPWGLPIEYRPSEYIGHTILTCGVYDLCTCEALWRLIDPGDTAIDIGANIGQMTALMAARVGPAGHVLAFEPHPDVFAILSRNADRWNRHAAAGRVRVWNRALSDHAGRGALLIPDDFETNQGGARLGPKSDNGRASYRRHNVDLSRLDNVVGPEREIGLIKLDVEEHERQVLDGAAALLENRRVRDIVLEQPTGRPTPATQLLASRGYTLFRLEQSFGGIRAVRGSQRTRRTTPADPPNCLATLDPDRALRRLGGRGWRVLRRNRLSRNTAATPQRNDR